MASAIEIFCCYARRDQPLLNKLKAHLMPLQHQGLITIWADIDIDAGIEWEKEIKKHLDTAQIILLLISPDFMNSAYCYSIEMKRALERHDRGEARVIPIILRPVYWQGAPFGRLKVLPTDAKPIISSRWYSPDEALLNITEGIHKIVCSLTTNSHLSKAQDKAVEPYVAGRYKGSAFNITYRTQGEITLSIQQTQGRIRGSYRTITTGNVQSLV